MCHERWSGGAEDARRYATPVALATEDGREMPGWTFRPFGPPGDGSGGGSGDGSGAGGRGTCLVVPDIYGPSPFYAELARLLAAEGYTATLVDYFFREGPLAERTREAAFRRRAGLDERRALRDLSAAVGRLGAGAPRTAVIGFCLAGQFALDLAAMRRDLATVSFYGFPEGVSGEVAVAAPRPVDLAGEITGPVLACWGTRDYIPLPVIQRFEKAMRDAGTDYTQLLLDGAGHGFLQGLVEEREDSAAARRAWLETLDFLAGAGLTGRAS
ncbi:dienelactone hydrolase family protein [Streptomyces aidingensis]|uniref:Carboxymethylenebutenolidase n=1 Tax=Streptomyces aidingensis TaxID=910347 RepID=A0A1I1H737_9ACTN|nr:dienelactone hydrolase family protein [Streptomyces aidingensis]SFC19631.1 carboxymethylenebutenolidase [Streptomyces aidingensis]